MSRTVLLFASFLVACGGSPEKSGNKVEEEGPVDADGDGLLDTEEADLGTDPALADTDGDGFSDFDEVETGYNPTFQWSHAIAEGDYAPGLCPSTPDLSVAGATGVGEMDYDGQHYEWTAYQKGDIVANWEGTDTFGQRISFYNFCGNYVLVGVGAAWCGPCQQMASTLEKEQAEIRESYPNFQAFELLMQNTAGKTPDDGTLDRWKSGFDLDTVAVVGPDDAAEEGLTPLDADGYIPTTILLSPTMEVISMDEGLTGSGVVAAIARYEAR